MGVRGTCWNDGSAIWRLDAIAWHDENSEFKVHAVKQQAANAWGLHDMIGNVWEWCSDWYEIFYPTGSVTNPMGPRSGSARVLRGGGWLGVVSDARSAKRNRGVPADRYYTLGFRPVLSAVRPALVAPTIVAQPQSVTVGGGLVAVFTVTATETGPLSYQWQRNEVNVAGATASTLIINNAKTTDAGDYRVVVNNSAGTVTSSVAKLTVVAPLIAAQPQSVTVTVGQLATLTVRATGTGPLSYQWQRNKVNVAGATASTLTINNAQTADAGEYRVVVSDAAGNATSASAMLTVYTDKPGGPAGFVWINPGTFVMGSPESEAGLYSDQVQHTVTLTQGFWMSDHETTQAEYQLVMGSNPSSQKGESLPVEMVSWNDAVAYCKKLTELERAGGRITTQQAYRLPTEAEWEYAARAGTTGARYGELDTIAWWYGNSGNHPHPVKQKAANAWGLHDMIGNVWEWCADWYGDYPTGSVTDPKGPGSGSDRVLRGGSWGSVAEGARSAGRVRSDPGFRGNYLGFRPALSAVR